MRRVAVTGGAGFIGRNLLAKFNEQSPETAMVVIDDFSTGSLDNLHGLNFELFEGSILDTDMLESALQHVDSVIHLGALGSVPRSIDDPLATHSVNATGTLNVLKVANSLNVRQVVLASSSSVYGSNPALPKREADWTSPMSPYAASKLAAEAYGSAYLHGFGLNVVIYRFFNVFGPWQSSGHNYAAVIPRFIECALSGQALPVFGDGNQTRDFTFVDDVCSVLIDTVRQRISLDRPINLAFGKQTSINSLIGMIGEILSTNLKVSFQDVRAGDVPASFANPASLAQLFPSISPVALRVALEATIDWYRDFELR